MSYTLTVQAKISGDAQSLVDAAQKGSRALRQLQADARNSTTGFDKLGTGILAGVRMGTNALSQIVTTTLKVGAAAAAAGATAAGAFAFKGAQAGLQRLEAIQDSTVALTRMLGSQQAAADLTAKALKIVQGTPFAFPDFAVAARQLVAFGVAADKVPPVLQAIADSAAASGQGQAAVAGLTDSFAKLQVQGKVSSDVLQQFGTAGVNGLGILANAYGKSTADMQAMITKGLVPSSQAMDILVAGIEHGSDGIAGHFNAIAGAAQDLGQTVSGSLGNVKAGFARMGASWLAPFQTDLPKVLNNGVIPLLDKLGAAGKAAGQKIADTGVMNKALDLFKRLGEAVGPVVATVEQAAKALSPLHAAWEALKSILPAVQSELSDTGREVMSTLVPALANLFKAVIPILPIILKLVDALAHGMTAALPVVTVMIQGIIGVLGPLVDMFSSLPAPVQGVVVALLALSKAGVPVGGFVKDIFATLGKLGGQFSTASEGIDGFRNKFRVASSEMGIFKAGIGGIADFFMGPWGIAIGAAVAGIGILVASTLPQAAKNVDELTASLDRQTGAFTNATKASVFKALHDSGAIEAANKLHLNLEDVTAAAMGNAEASKRVNDQMVTASRVFEQQRAAGEKTTMTDVEMGGAIKAVAEALGGQVDAVNQAVTSSKNWLQATGAAKTAQDAFKASADQLASAFAANGINTDHNSASYKANLVALNDLGAKAKDYITTTENQYHSVQKTTAAQDDMARSVYASAVQMGMSAAEAAAYTAKILGIPKTAVTTAVANVDDARMKLDGLETAVNSIDGRVVTIYAQANIAAATHDLANAMNAANQFAKGNVYTKVNANGGMWNTTGQHVTQAFADGGSVGMGIYNARNPGIFKFAEPSTRWETFISGKPGQEDRARALTLQTAERLGMNLSGGGTTKNVSVVTHLYGVDPQVTADLISHNVQSSLE